MKIGIIGAGAAGMSAAIAAAQNGADVTLIEHTLRIGKKLLLTGSGKCNISNVDMCLEHFHSSDRNIVSSVFEECPPDEALSFLRQLGLVTKNRNGYLYPYSEQASSVLDIYRFAIRDLEINVLTDAVIEAIDNNKNIFSLTINNKKYSFDRLIICCGSKAYKNTGSDGSGYEIARKFGHTIIKPLSALTFFNCKENFYPSIAGIRTKASVELQDREHKVLAKESGELQLTKTGISGIPVFNISYIAAKYIDKNLPIYAKVDFMPDISESELIELVNDRINKYSNRQAEELLSGIFHKNLGLLFIKQLGIKPNTLIRNLDTSKDEKLANIIKNFVVEIESCGGFDNSQVCSGGIDTHELVGNTMESKLVNNLYFAGEIIDVNGDCGGYNLTWAICTGILAGRNSSK